MLYELTHHICAFVLSIHYYRIALLSRVDFRHLTRVRARQVPGDCYGYTGRRVLETSFYLLEFLG